MSLPSSRTAKNAASLQRAGSEGRLILPGGRCITYMEFGDLKGLPAFGFHGTPGSRFMFRLTQAAGERLGLRIIAPERPGYGRASPQKHRTLSGYAQDIAALADALGIGAFAVAGVSGGGPYAAACAALLPDRVLAAALISPMGPIHPPDGAARIGPAHHAIFRLLPKTGGLMRGIFSIGRLGFLQAPLLMHALLLSRAAPSDWKILQRREVRVNLLEGVAEGVRRGVGGVSEEMRVFARPWDISLDAIRAPVFLWQGTLDRNVPPEAAFKLAQLIPGCKLIRLEGAGHYWVFDHMNEILGALRDAAMREGMAREAQAAAVPNAMSGA